MPRLLSGIQPSGQLHLGNWAGAIRQFVQMQGEYESFVFVASYHAMTSGMGQGLWERSRQVVIDYLAFGLDPARCNIYLQQDLPEVTELAWMLSTVCPFSLMDKGVSFKDKTAKGLSASVGLFTYPILQAADICIVDADVVPVGQDQIQHIEICRDLALKINHAVGSEVLKLPQVRIRKDAAILPGIDGEKMSKSYGNTIDPFAPEKELKKRISAIKTDSKGVDDPKDPEGCTIFQIYQGVAGADDQRSLDLAARYRQGGLGYGHAKMALLELILDTFKDARARRQALMQDPTHIDAVLKQGADAARRAATPVMDRVRKACGIRG